MVNEKNIEFSLKEKIMKLLIEDKKQLSIRQVSENLNADYKNTYNTIKCSPDLIIRDKKGNTTFVEIKFMPKKEIYSVEYKRTREFLSKNPRLKLISEDIRKVNYPFMIVLIFGSYAKKQNTESSDIDLCIISDNRKESSKLINALELHSQKIEIQEFTTKEFVSMLDQRQNNLGHEIVKNNILLFGVENYYNLVSKWMKKE